MAAAEEEPPPSAVKAGTGMVLSLKGAIPRKKPVGFASGGGGGGVKSTPGVFGGGDAEDMDDHPKAELIRSLEGGKAEEAKAPLVIQVREPRWRREAQSAAGTGQGANGSTAEGGSAAPSLEQLAAAELVREARGEATGDDSAESSTRIIHLSNGAGGGDPDAPMLVRNAVPIPKELVDEKARLKYELSLREDDIDPSSDVYKSVPVAEFGAALLRGMGWAGPSEDDVKVYEVKARPEGLGLGADPAVLELDAHGKKKKKRGMYDSDKAKAALAKAAEERIKKQVLKSADVVRIKEGVHAGKRAMVSKAEGVGGIQMVEVELEATGDLARVKVHEVFKVAPQELADDPFVRKDGPSPRSSRAEQTDDEKRRKRSRSGSREKKKQKKKRRSRSRSRGRDDDSSSKSKKRAVEESSSRSSSGSSDWLVSRIRVRIITNKPLGRDKKDFYRKTGVVVDVSRSGEGTVRLDSGEVIDGLPSRYLETALPGVNGQVLVLRGRHRHRRAKLLEKDRDREQGVIELLDDLSVHRLSLDDIAEFKGKEDDMEVG